MTGGRWSSRLYISNDYRSKSEVSGFVHEEMALICIIPPFCCWFNRSTYFEAHHAALLLNLDLLMVLLYFWLLEMVYEKSLPVGDSNVSLDILDTASNVSSLVASSFIIYWLF